MAHGWRLGRRWHVDEAGSSENLVSRADSPSCVD